ncbi:MAG: DJ-1/PfpI family protein [Bacteroidales bacterium]|nr:DJ-1/PfpI family protein [Bacteroidales bacterium]
MKRSYIFLATGFEEIEALATADVLRRAGMEVSLIAIHKDRMVTGANGITVAADMLMAGADLADADWLIFPGGMPGAENLHRDAALNDALHAHVKAGGRVAAICAAPALVLAQAGVLQDKKATCYPGFEDYLTRGGATHAAGRVVVDGNVITANGPSSALPFGYAIVEQTLGKKVADEISAGMLY